MRQMRSTILPALTTGVLLISGAKATLASPYCEPAYARIPPSSCQGWFSADASVLQRDASGCTNANNSAAYPSCGSPATILFPIESPTRTPINGFLAVKNKYENGDSGFLVDYTDTSPSENIACTIYITQRDGYAFASQTKWSSGSGSGTFSWSNSQLPNAGATIEDVRDQHISCSLPDKFYPSGSGCAQASSGSRITYINWTAQVCTSS
jgi:hypothetical protein